MNYFDWSRIAREPALLELDRNMFTGFFLDPDDLGKRSSDIDRGKRVDGKVSLSNLYVPRADQINGDFGPWVSQFQSSWCFSMCAAGVFVSLASVASFNEVFNRIV